MLARAAAAVRPLLRSRCASTAPRCGPDGATACAPAAAAGDFGVFVTQDTLRALGDVAFVDLHEEGAQLVQGAPAAAGLLCCGGAC